MHCYTHAHVSIGVCPFGIEQTRMSLRFREQSKRSDKKVEKRSTEWVASVMSLDHSKTLYKHSIHHNIVSNFIIQMHENRAIGKRKEKKE